MKKDYVFYVDDTGFNTQDKTSCSLRNEFGTYVGVLIPKDCIPFLNEFMDKACSSLSKRYNDSEFHFTDIYNRRGNFKNINIEETIDIIGMFVDLFNELDLKIFVHTSTNEPKNAQMQILQSNINTMLKAMNIDANDKSQALILSYLRAKQYADKNNITISHIVCDEGLRKKGAVARCNNLSIHFDSSRDDRLLQLADFAAWFLTRVKQIFDKAVTKRNISDIDKAILEEYAYLNNNFIGLTKEKINLDNFTNFSYDEIIERHKKKLEEDNKP